MSTVRDVKNEISLILLSPKNNTRPLPFSEYEKRLEKMQKMIAENSDVNYQESVNLYASFVNLFKHDISLRPMFSDIRNCHDETMGNIFSGSFDDWKEKMQYNNALLENVATPIKNLKLEFPDNLVFPYLENMINNLQLLIIRLPESVEFFNVVEKGEKLTQNIISFGIMCARSTNEATKTDFKNECRVLFEEIKTSKTEFENVPDAIKAEFWFSPAAIYLGQVYNELCIRCFRNNIDIE